MHEGRLAEHAQVLGHRGPRDAELGHHQIRQIARLPLAIGESLEDAAANGVTDDVERVDHEPPGLSSPV